MEKPPFKLTIAFDAATPENLEAALQFIQERCGEHDQTHSVKAKVSIESLSETTLIEIREELEDYLRRNRYKIVGKVTSESPLVRPVDTERPMDAYLRGLT